MAFNRHCDLYFPIQQGVLFWTHIPNQGRDAQQGDKLKKMGVNAGMFDYLFEGMYERFIVAHLEAKVHGREYSRSQKTFDSITTGFPIFKDIFYSVEEGHYKLIEAGIKPIRPCTIFREPDYRNWQEKTGDAMAFYAPPPKA